MQLRAFLSNLAPPEFDAFAARCDVTPGHLRNVMYGQRSCATDLAVSIERESRGQVTRPELREDWRRHWPELVKSRKPPRVKPAAKAREGA